MRNRYRAVGSMNAARILAVACFFLLAVSALLVASYLTAARAATVLPVTTEDCSLSLTGAIETGDLERLKAAEGERSGKDGDLRVLCLSSGGGSFEEALRIASYIYGNFLSTHVAAGAECYSACALIWLAGETWMDTFVTSRTLNVRGKLGFHAPYIERGALAGIPVDETTVLEAYVAANQAIAELVDIPQANQNPFDDDIVPTRLLADMLRQGPRSFSEVDTVGTAVRWHIDLTGFEAPSVVDRQSLCNACNNHFPEQMDCDLPDVTYKRRKDSQSLVIPGVGAEGAFACVALVPMKDGRPDGLLVNLIDMAEGKAPSYTRDDLLTDPSWYLYPKSTPIAELAGR